MKLYFEAKKLNENESSIRAIICSQGQKSIISTGIRIQTKDWKNGGPKHKQELKPISLALGKYASAFSSYMQATEVANEVASLTKAKEWVLANVNQAAPTKGSRNPLELLEAFNQSQQGKLKEGALKPYKTLINHLQDYNNKVQFADFSEAWADKFTLWLSEKSKHVDGAVDLQNPTINKMVVTLKAYCKWAWKNKYTASTEWKAIKKVKERDQRIITLTKDEFITYAYFDFQGDTKLEKQRDVFCFATFTGLRFEDLAQVNMDNLKFSGDAVYLHLNTDKTGSELKMRLVPSAVALLEKYDWKLPLISNQKTNQNIKLGVKKAGITRTETVVVQHLNNISYINKPIYELISIHDARKGFITLSLQHGMSISEVMGLSTHKDYRSFSRYVNLEQELINTKLASVFALRKVG